MSVHPGVARLGASAPSEAPCVLDGARVEIGDPTYYATGGKVFRKGVWLDDLTAKRLLPYFQADPCLAGCARELSAAIHEAKRQANANA